jgi:hypothetical protein
VGGQVPSLKEGGRDHYQHVEGQDPGPQEGVQVSDQPVGGQDPSLQEGGRDHDHQVGGQDCQQHVGELDHDPPVGGPSPDQQMRGENQCAYLWWVQILATTEDDASEDNVPRDCITANESDVPNGVDGDHTHPDEGDAPKTPEEGCVKNHLVRRPP